MTYDCFTFFNELDLLEIRLNILDPHVDFFVLGESEETFSGNAKSLYYRDNIDRFQRWKNKIIHVINPKFDTTDSFARAFHQKENLINYLDKINDDDLVYFGDLDEIWKPQQVTDNRIFKLKQLNYCYYLNNRSSEQWIGTIVGKWSSIRQKGFNYNRAHPENFIEDGGWHFTCMGGADQIRKKLESYDHQEYNLDWIKNSIEERMDRGLDFLARPNDWQGKPFSFWIEEEKLPKYLVDNRGRYENLFKK